MSQKHVLLTLLLCMFFSVSFASAVLESVSLKDYTIDFEYDLDDAEAGDTFRIEATITNEAGEERSDIELELELDDPFDEVGDNTKEVGTLEDGESKSVSFRVEIDDDADEGDYDIDFEIRDNDSDEGDEFTVEVTSNLAELIIGSITSLPTVITPDTDDIQLTLTIENIGDDEAKAVRVKLHLPEGVTPSGSYSDIANLGTIPAGESKEVDFFIDTAKRLDSENLQASLFIEYESDNSDKSETIRFDLPIKGRPQFQVQNVVFSPNKLSPGSDGTVRISIINIGEEEGKETSIRVFENSDVPFSFNEKTNFIGNVLQGNTGTGIISFSVDSDANVNNYLVKVQVRTVSEGNVMVDEFTVPITVSEGEPFDFRIIILIITIIIILVIIIVVWRVLRRK